MRPSKARQFFEGVVVMLIFMVPLMVVGTIESRETYDRCIHEGSKQVYTDMDTVELERKCEGAMFGNTGY